MSMLAALLTKSPVLSILFKYDWVSSFSGQFVYIIKDTCFAGVVGTRAIGREGEAGLMKKLVQKEFKFCHRAFSFGRDQYNTQIYECTIHFCVRRKNMEKRWAAFF